MHGLIVHVFVEEQSGEKTMGIMIFFITMQIYEARLLFVCHHMYFKWRARFIIGYFVMNEALNLNKY